MSDEPTSGAAPAAEPAAAAPPVDPIMDVLSFDPFADEGGPEPPEDGSGTPPPAAPPAGPSTVSPPQDAPTTGAPPASPPPAAQPPAVGESPEMKTLREQLDAMRRDYDQLRRSLPQPGVQQGASPTPPAPKDDGLAQRYAIQVPQTILEAMASEDGNLRSQGLAALVQGLGVHIHRNVMRDAQALLQTQVPTMMQSRENAQQTATRIREDFYGKFKQLNNPVFFPIVQQFAAQEMARLGTSEWSDSVRDAVGNGVIAAMAAAGLQLAQAAPPPAAPPTVPPATPPAARQPFMSGGGARPSAAPTDPNSPASIAASLGF